MLEAAIGGASVGLCRPHHGQDGRVGFIDFGIVGRIPQRSPRAKTLSESERKTTTALRPKIWSAVEGFALSFAANDAAGMAKNLIVRSSEQKGHEGRHT